MLDMLLALFNFALDLGNILGGIILAGSGLASIEVEDRYARYTKTVAQAAEALTKYSVHIGAALLVIATIYLVIHIQTPVIYEVCGIFVGTTLVKSLWTDYPQAAKFLDPIADGLLQHRVTLGITAIVVGLYGSVMFI